jgi:hypothetical protein
MNFLSNKCIINLLLPALLPPHDLSLRIFNLIRHFTSGYIHRKISLISYMQHSSLFFNWLEKDQTRPYLFKDKNFACLCKHTIEEEESCMASESSS